MDPNHIVTSEFVLSQGLTLYGISMEKRSKWRSKRLHKEFRKKYGATPYQVATIYEDLMTTDIADARINPREFTLRHFLMTFDFIKNYHEEDKLMARWGISCDKTLRKWLWEFMKKISSLKDSKVSTACLNICWVLLYTNMFIWLTFTDRLAWGMEPRPSRLRSCYYSNVSYNRRWNTLSYQRAYSSYHD